MIGPDSIIEAVQGSFKDNTAIVLNPGVAVDVGDVLVMTGIQQSGDDEGKIITAVPTIVADPRPMVGCLKAVTDTDLDVPVCIGGMGPCRIKGNTWPGQRLRALAADTSLVGSAVGSVEPCQAISGKAYDEETVIRARFGLGMRVTFPLTIITYTSVGDNKWKYFFNEVYLTGDGYGNPVPGYGNWQLMPANPLWGSKLYNMMEHMNSAAGAQGNGIPDVTKLDTAQFTFAIAPWPTYNIMLGRCEYWMDGSTLKVAYWTASPNGIGGECD